MISRQRIYAAGRRFFQSRLIPVWLAFIAIVMTLPSLGNGYARDDHLMRASFEGMRGLPGYDLGPRDTFEFFSGDPEQTAALVDRGLLPWWTAPELKVSFWRPLSSWLHWLDLYLFGDNPVVMQVHSVLWYALLCVMVALLYRQFLVPLWIAGLAALLYTIDDDHGIVVGWLCNRNGLITAVAGAAVLMAHDTWRRGGKAWAAPVTYALFAVGLLSAEAGVGIGAYLFAYALFMDKGAWWKRFLTLVPYGLMVVVYLVAYRAMGYGTLGSNWYLDPGTSPVAFLLRLAGNLPILVCTFVFIWPTWTWQFRTPAEEPILFGFILAVLGWFLYVYWPLLRRHPQAAFWLTGAVLSLVPSCAVVPHHRLTIFAGVGGMAVTALFLGGYWTNADWVPQDRRRWRINARVAVVLLLITHVLLASYQLPFYSMNMAIAGENTDVADSSIPATPAVREKTVILLHSPDDFFPWLFFIKRSAEGRPMPEHLRLLNSSRRMHITREDDHTLLLEPEDGFVPYTWHSPMRSSATPMQRGDVFELSGMTVTVTEVDAEGWPMAARFRFDMPLDDPSLVWLGLVMEGRHSVHLGRTIMSPVYIPVRMPAIGQTLSMRHVIERSAAYDRLRMDAGSLGDEEDEEADPAAEGA